MIQNKLWHWFQHFYWERLMRASWTLSTQLFQSSGVTKAFQHMGFVRKFFIWTTSAVVGLPKNGKLSRMTISDEEIKDVANDWSCNQFWNCCFDTIVGSYGNHDWNWCCCIHCLFISKVGFEIDASKLLCLEVKKLFF